MKDRNRKIVRGLALLIGGVSAVSLIPSIKEEMERNKREREYTESINAVKGYSGEQLLDKLPDKIPGGLSIDKEGGRVEGSKYLFVHVKQSHAPPLSHLKRLIQTTPAESFGIVSREYSQCFTATEKSQKSVAQVFEELVRIYGVRHVYDEGLSEKNESDDLSDRVVREEKLREIHNFELQNLTVFEDSFMIERKGWGEYLLGGVSKLGREGRLRVMITQNRKTLEEADRMIQEGKKWENQKWMNLMGKLEDDTIKIVGGSSYNLAITAYGFNHDFTNNIQEWNAKHPDRKFSYAVITPENQ